MAAHCGSSLPACRCPDVRSTPIYSSRYTRHKVRASVGSQACTGITQSSHTWSAQHCNRQPFKLQAVSTVTDARELLEIEPPHHTPGRDVESLESLLQLEVNSTSVTSSICAATTCAPDASQQDGRAAILVPVSCRVLDEHQWGTGLSVEQFITALQTLPGYARVSWTSYYPAVGTGSRGAVHQVHMQWHCWL